MENRTKLIHDSLQSPAVHEHRDCVTWDSCDPQRSPLYHCDIKHFPLVAYIKSSCLEFPNRSAFRYTEEKGRGISREPRISQQVRDEPRSHRRSQSCGGVCAVRKFRTRGSNRRGVHPRNSTEPSRTPLVGNIPATYQFTAEIFSVSNRVIKSTISPSFAIERGTHA